MFAMLRQRNLGLLFAGHLVSQVGDMVLFIALPFWIYRLTGSAAATGAMFVALTLPQLFLSPIAGVFVDRWDRKVTMIVADLPRAGIVLGMLAVHGRDQVWIIYVLAFAESSVSRFFLPARTAVLPQLVSRDDLPRANAALGVSDALTQLGGPALGGVLVAVWGTRGAITLDAFSYLVSAIIISMLRVPSLERARAVASSGLDAVAAVVREMLEGVQVVTRRPELPVLAPAGVAVRSGRLPAEQAA